MRRMSRTILGFGLSLTVFGCGKGAEKDVEKSATPGFIAPPAAPAAHAPRNTLTELRWILGPVRGTGAGGTVQAPFFERYSLLGDSALVVESFKDSTFGGAPDSTRYALRGDSLTSADAAATNVSPTSLTFSSRRNPGLAWTWRRDDDSTWTAIIVNAIPNGPPKTRAYRMVRVR